MINNPQNRQTLYRISQKDIFQYTKYCRKTFISAQKCPRKTSAQILQNIRERHIPRTQKKYFSKELVEYSRKTYLRNQNIREILEEH
jgi:hypothetical protein